MTKKFTWKEVSGIYYAYYGDEGLGIIKYHPEQKVWVWKQWGGISMDLRGLDNVCIKLHSLNKEVRRK